MIKLNKQILHLLAAAGIFAAFGSSSMAGEDGKLVIDDKAPIESWTICDIFDKHYLIDRDYGFIRTLRPTGRYQGQWISQQEDVNNTLDNGYHKYQHRRFRLGVEVGLANDLTFAAEANIANNHQLTRGDFIDNFQDFYIEWEPSDDFLVRVGKQKQHFTLEDKTSSKRIRTVERSVIVNETAGGRPWGAVVEAQTGDFRHQIGAWLYGGHADGPSWVDFQSNGGASYNVYYDMNDCTTLHFDYVFADTNSGTVSSRGQAANGFGPAYEHAIALGGEFECEKLNVISDVIYAWNRPGQRGGGNSARIPNGNDTWGFYVLPSYDITDKLQAVFRYGYMAEGREQRTQRFGVRQNVENYHTFYAGFQYFICDDKLKLLGGYEHATGELFGTNTDIESGSWQLGLRTYF